MPVSQILLSLCGRFLYQPERNISYPSEMAKVLSPIKFFTPSDIYFAPFSPILLSLPKKIKKEISICFTQC